MSAAIFFFISLFLCCIFVWGRRYTFFLIICWSFDQFLTDRDLYFLFFFTFVRSNFVFIQFANNTMFALFVTNAKKMIFSTMIIFNNIFAHFIYVFILLTIETLRQFIFFIEIFANFEFVIFYDIFFNKTIRRLWKIYFDYQRKFFFEDFDDSFKSNNFCNF